jgi:hypothetical protein
MLVIIIVGVAVAGLDPWSGMILTCSEPRLDGGEAFLTEVGRQNALVVIVGVDMDMGDEGGE